MGSRKAGEKGSSLVKDERSNEPSTSKRKQQGMMGMLAEAEGDDSETDENVADVSR